MTNLVIVFIYSKSPHYDIAKIRRARASIYEISAAGVRKLELWNCFFRF